MSSSTPIFISYRRQDSAGHVLALLVALRHYFGSDRIFQIPDDIAPGQELLEFVQDELDSLSVLLAIIGRDWLTVQDNRLRRRRIDNPDDPVRLVLATALQSRILVIPVLVGGGVMPAVDDLPPDLSDLARQGAFELSDSRWDHHVQGLITVIRAVSSVHRAPIYPDDAASSIDRQVQSTIETVADHLKPRPVRDSMREPPPDHPSRTSAPTTERHVKLGVSAPRGANSGSQFAARFVAYVEERESAVKELLHSLDPPVSGSDRQIAVGLTPDRGGQWLVGTPVTVRVYGDYVTAQPATRLFEWNGQENLISFLMAVDPDAPATTIQLCFEAFLEGVSIAFIPLTFQVGPEATDVDPSVFVSHPASTAFASYASKDAPLVALCLSALKRWDPHFDVFMDCLDLTPNERWQDELTRVIPSKDTFLLFWSVNAKNSKWVAWELQVAETTRGLAYVRPMPIDDPDVAPPPDQLKHLQFRDRYLMARQGFLRLDEDRGAGPSSPV